MVNFFERQREGIAKAKAEGKYKGRRPLRDELVSKIKAMHATSVARTISLEC